MPPPRARLTPLSAAPLRDAPPCEAPIQRRRDALRHAAA